MLVFSTPWLGRQRVCVCMGLVSSPRQSQGHQTPAGQLVSYWCCDSSVLCATHSSEMHLQRSGRWRSRKGNTKLHGKGYFKEEQSSLSPAKRVSPARISIARGPSWRWASQDVSSPCLCLPASHLECPKRSLCASSVTHTWAAHQAHAAQPSRLLPHIPSPWSSPAQLQRGWQRLSPKSGGVRRILSCLAQCKTKSLIGKAEIWPGTDKKKTQNGVMRTWKTMWHCKRQHMWLV